MTHYLAHNMTVTPRNLGEVADVIRDCRDMGFRMFSFQPAAFVGNQNRWKDDYRAFSADEVWARDRARRRRRGCTADALQIGDVRCNRTAYGGYVGDRYVPLLDEDDPRDAALAATSFFARVRRDGLRRAAARCLAARLARGFAREPARAAAASPGWAARFVARAGGPRACAARRRR